VPDGAKCTVTVRLDKRALDRELQGRDGAVGHVIAGFGGIVTKEIKAVFRERAGGVFWKTTTHVEQGTRGTRAIITVKRSKPHSIVAKNAPALIFYWQRESKWFVGPSVNHPGSAPPEELILSGIANAGRRVTFTRAAPTIA
jgi:hypothetical protein